MKYILALVIAVASTSAFAIDFSTQNSGPITFSSKTSVTSGQSGNIYVTDESGAIRLTFRLEKGNILSTYRYTTSFGKDFPEQNLYGTEIVDLGQYLSLLGPKCAGIFTLTRKGVLKTVDMMCDPSASISSNSNHG